MRRYWVPASFFIDQQVHFSGDIFHHIFDVCRQNVGSHFEVLGDGDRAHLVEVLSVERKKALAKILETRTLPALPKPRLVLALSIPRFPVMESVIEKAVEMGVQRIVPFYSEFSFIRKKGSLPAGKMDRWQKIVISATQQSGRAELMQIDEPCDLSDLLQKFNQSPRTQGLFAYEGSSNLALRESLKDQSIQELDDFWVFVGSEGGFSQTEVELFRGQGLNPVTLGDQILRVETACIALLAVLKYEFGRGIS